jgi:hypothetical protein
MGPLSTAFQTLKSEWPKLVATGILIPSMQWGAGFAWRRRRRSRAAELRVEILAVEDFIAKHQSTIPDDGTLDEVTRNSKDDVAQLLKELEKVATPFAISHPRAALLGKIFLLSPPKYTITWITRFFFFAGFASIFISLYRSYPHYFTVISLIRLANPALGIVLYNWLTRRADGVSGPIVKRPLWRRISLFYWPVSIAAGTCQLFCWFYILGLILISRELSDDASAHFYFFIIALALVAFIWSLAVHLDRTGIAREADTLPSSDPPQSVVQLT